jgi:hypothetical protein
LRELKVRSFFYLGRNVTAVAIIGEIRANDESVALRLPEMLDRRQI